MIPIAVIHPVQLNEELKRVEFNGLWGKNFIHIRIRTSQ